MIEYLFSLITLLSVLLSNEFIFVALVAAMVFMSEKRNEKRAKILFSILLISALVLGLKMFFAEPRPCEGAAGIVECPTFPFTSYSFPSGHAAIAFLLMIAFLDKPSFPFYWVFAFFAAYSRIFLGVHNFEDIAGALVLAPVAYYLAGLLWGRFCKNANEAASAAKPPQKAGANGGSKAALRDDSAGGGTFLSFISRETQRQLAHVALGVFLIALLFFLGRSKMLYFLSGTLFIGFLLINLVVRGYKVPIASWFVESFERKGAPLPGYGSAWYVIGLLLSCLLISDINFLAATIVILAFGDAASTIFGRRGVYPIPYNPRKTFEGTSAFFLFSLLGYPFIGWKIFPLALVAAVVESLPIKIDDNLTIPLACVIVFHLL